MAEPVGQSIAWTSSTAVVPSIRGRSVTCWLRVLTTMRPPPLTTAPTMTRRPLPTQPRVGLRHCLETYHRFRNREAIGQLLG